MAGDLQRSGGCVGGGVRPSRRKFLATAGTTVAGAVLLNAFPSRAVADEQVHHRPTCVAVDASQYVFSSDDDGKLIRYEIDSSQNPPKLSNAREYKTRHMRNGSYLKASYVTVAGDRVVTAGYDGKVLLHDRNDPTHEAIVFDKHITSSSQPEVWTVVLSKNGDRALSATNDGKILLWRTTDLSVIGQFDDSHDRQMKTGPIGGLAFLPDAQGNPETQFLSTHGYGLINLWTIEPPARKDEYSHGTSRPVNTVAVRGDGKYFVTAGFDQIVRLWEVGKKKPIKSFKGHGSAVWRVAISADGNSAVSAGDDKSAFVWDIDPLHQRTDSLHSLENAPNGVMGVGFVGSSNKLIAVTTNDSSSNNPLQIWAI